MARNADITLTAGTWTQITADDATVVGLQNKSGYNVILMATTAATPPTAGTTEGYLLRPWSDASLTLASAFPGLTSPVRLYGFCEIAVPMFVSHD